MLVKINGTALSIGPPTGSNHILDRIGHNHMNVFVAKQDNPSQEHY